MNLAIRVLACVALSPLVCYGEPGPASAITPAEYRAELVRLLAAVEEPAPQGGTPSAAAESLPATWRVHVDGRDFVISTDSLRDDLRALAGKAQPELRARVRGRLTRLLADLDGFEASPAGTGKERRLLSAILARPEFAAVHGPSWYERLRQRIAATLLQLVSSIFGSSRFPVIASTIVFMLVGLALLVTILWVYRTLGGGPRQIVVPDVPVSAKAWPIWLQEARQAAAAGQWRDAVRLAYWTAISCLESQRVWPPDRARTPREYLRLLPADSGHRSPLSALTRTFERVWYGSREADLATFAEITGELEKLGCR